MYPLVHIYRPIQVGSGSGMITVTTVAELYDQTSAFGRRVYMTHTCARSLRLCNMSVAVLAVARDRDITWTTDATVAKGGLVRDPCVIPIAYYCIHRLR